MGNMRMGVHIDTPIGCTISVHASLMIKTTMDTL